MRKDRELILYDILLIILSLYLAILLRFDFGMASMASEFKKYMIFFKLSVIPVIIIILFLIKYLIYIVVYGNMLQ